MAMLSAKGGAPLSEINVTPLVDVMLVLLIIFMVSAPLLTTGIDVDLPDARAPRLDVDKEKLLLTVTAEKKVYLGETEVPYDKIEEALSRNEKLKTDRELYIQADESVPYGLVAKVMATVRRAGVEKLGIVTDPLASE
jgi:biopolymer transport protein TolR